ncbi:MAG TPA: choice-of-anchor tandem repeat GloVer-containing protein [Rhizomicrobium sp.]|nr:choice-of-anchor tandem repeat GloVer-containing protein [Rhizomicrobium sp.]
MGRPRQAAGTAFSLDPATGIETVLHTFSAKREDGRGPQAGLIGVNGTLYGTTEYGGAYNAGAVFSLDPTTGAEAVLYSFKGYPSDGAGPVAGLLHVNGSLYGTTFGGGAQDLGTVFAIDLATSAETALYSFQGYPSDGAEPGAGLIDVNGSLYGTTEDGGAQGCKNEQGEYIGCGTAFSINLQLGSETELYSFCGEQFCADGQEPLAALISLNGVLYGTTELGGEYGYGAVFSIVP